MNTLIICLLLAVLMPYLIKGVVAHFMKMEGGYDNHHPRLQMARLAGMGARAVGAHQNGFESLIVFATAALTAMVTNHLGYIIQALAVIYIISRVIYNILYIKNFASLRSLVWTIGFLCCLAILIICLF